MPIARTPLPPLPTFVSAPHVLQKPSRSAAQNRASFARAASTLASGQATIVDDDAIRLQQPQIPGCNWAAT